MALARIAARNPAAAAYRELTSDPSLAECPRSACCRAWSAPTWSPIHPG